MMLFQSVHFRNIMYVIFSVCVDSFFFNKDKKGDQYFNTCLKICLYDLRVRMAFITNPIRLCFFFFFFVICLFQQS